MGTALPGEWTGSAGGGSELNLPAPLAHFFFALWVSVGDGGELLHRKLLVLLVFSHRWERSSLILTLSLLLIHRGLLW